MRTPAMTPTRRRQPFRRTGAPISSFSSRTRRSEAVPPATSWWVGVDRAVWRAAVAEHEQRWHRTETSTPTPGV